LKGSLREKQTYNKNLSKIDLELPDMPTTLLSEVNIEIDRRYHIELVINMN
jgi:hypothetical protein